MPTIYLAKCVLVMRLVTQEYNSSLYYTTMDDTSPKEIQKRGHCFYDPLVVLR